MAVSAKTRAKRHAKIKQGWEVGVPHWNPMDYTLSMMKTCNYFASEVEGKIKQELAINYWVSQQKDVTGFNKLSDGWFTQAGILAYLASNDIQLGESDESKLSSKYTQLATMVQSKEARAESEGTKPAVKPERNPQDAIRERAAKLGAEIDHEIDLLCTTKSSDFDTKEFLTKNEISAPVAKQIGSYYHDLSKELKSVASDEQLEEAYSYLGKRQLKKMIDFVDGIISACNNIAIVAKTTRKPRQRKEKPASVIAAKVKYSQSSSDYNLKSVHPANVVGADEVWLFNTRLRKLFKYVAQDGMTLSWKGTTLQNFDPEKSGGKTIRKPSEFFAGFHSMTKRPLTKLFNDVRSVLASVNGRCSEDILILKVF